MNSPTLKYVYIVLNSILQFWLQSEWSSTDILTMLVLISVYFTLPNILGIYFLQSLTYILAIQLLRKERMRDFSLSKSNVPQLVRQHNTQRKQSHLCALGNFTYSFYACSSSFLPPHSNIERIQCFEPRFISLFRLFLFCNKSDILYPPWIN